MDIPDNLKQFADKIFAGEYEMPTDGAPATALDIGGNAGAFSVWVHDRWPDAAITLYEPQHDMAELARRNAPFATIHQAAVKRASGRDVMRYGKTNAGEASFHTIEGDTFAVECVAAHSIPSHEFVKIDTEGCELEILNGLDLSATRYIALEYHRREDINEIRALLFARGFKLHSHDHYNAHCGVMKWTKLIQSRRIFLANCVDSGAKHLWYRCVERLSEHAPCEMTQQDVVGDSLVPRARNALTAAFYHSDCSHLLFIDSDIVFTSQHVAQLLSHGVPVVAGFYPKKQQELEWVCNAHDEAGEADDATGLQPMKYMGTGFMLIERAVIERLIERFPQLAYSPDDRPDEMEWDLWSIGVYVFPDGLRRYLSEDWFFCQRCHDIDIPVYGDTRLVVQHIGDAIYPLKSHRSQYVVKKK